MLIQISVPSTHQRFARNDRGTGYAHAVPCSSTMQYRAVPCICLRAHGCTVLHTRCKLVAQNAALHSCMSTQAYVKYDPALVLAVPTLVRTLGLQIGVISATDSALTSRTLMPAGSEWPRLSLWKGQLYNCLRAPAKPPAGCQHLLHCKSRWPGVGGEGGGTKVAWGWGCRGCGTVVRCISEKCGWSDCP